MVYPDNPLDETWTDKGSFKKEPKPLILNAVGNGMPKNAIVYKPFKIRETGQIVDLAKQRLNERTRLLNYKAERIEAGLYDYLTQNEIERAYQKQLADIAKLQAMFENGVLGFMFDTIKTKATNQYREQFLQNDPDVVNFDRQSEELAKETTDIANLQASNDKLYQELATQTQQVETQLIENLRVAESIEQTEELGEIIDEIDSVKSELELLKPIVDNDVFDDEDGIEGSSSISDEDAIRKARADETLLVNRLEMTQQRLAEIRNRVEGKGIKNQLDRLGDNIATIRRYSRLGQEPVRMERRIENIIRDAERMKPAKYQTIRQQNIALEKYIKSLEEQFEGATIPRQK